MSSFSLAVPESWWEFDVRPEGREATIRTLVDERVRDMPELAPYRADVSAMLRKMAKDAHDSGALYLGCMAENFDGIPLSATLTVSVLGAKNKQGVALSTDPRAIADSLRTITPRREGDAWRKVTTVEIPEVGLGARTYGVEDVPVSRGGQPYPAYGADPDVRACSRYHGPTRARVGGQPRAGPGRGVP